ncbi:hypothetical protein PTKIN_Ptkin17bG0136200 [Pterospermum kingtungense]
MGYIGAHGVAALRRYKYSGEDRSYLAKYVLQPLCNRLVSFFPLWMPIYVLGYICPACLYIFTSIGFTPTQMGSFCTWITSISISGCDALACALVIMAVGSTTMCKRDTFWFWVISAIPFYGATWEHYFTNSLILPEINGANEGVALIYTCHFITSFVGAQWWAQQIGKSIPFFSWVPSVNEIPTYRVVLYSMTAFGVLPTVALNVSNVHTVIRTRKGSMLRALAMLYPFVLLMAGVLVWDYLSPSDIIGSYPHLIVLGTGLAFGFLVGRMILAHLCDEAKGLKTNMCMSLLYLPLPIANALTARLNGGVPLVDEFWVVLGYLAFTASLYLHFAISVIHEITTALGIHCFRLSEAIFVLLFLEFEDYLVHTGFLDSESIYIFSSSGMMAALP